MNEAISGLEKSFEISSEADSSPNALTLKAAYRSAFRWVFGKTRWSFLIRKKILRNEVTTDEKNPDFNYAFSFPEDFGRLLDASRQDIFGTTYIYDYVVREPYVDLSIFGREGNLIYSNFRPVFIVYLSKNDLDMEYAPPDVIEAIMLKMKSVLAWSHNQNRPLSDSFNTQALHQVREAQNNNYFEAERYVRNRAKIPNTEFSRSGT